MLWQTLRRMIPLLLMLVVIGAVTMGAQAQDNGDRRLSANQPVTSSLDAENFAETYVFEASAGNTITLTATTGTPELSLALMLTGPNGAIIARDGDLATPQAATLSNIALPQDGTYTVAIMRGTGADGDASGDYTLILAGQITAPSGEEVTAPVSPTIREGDNIYVILPDGGVDIGLTWSSAVDLNLEVRDPVGGTLFFDSLTTNSGGTHSGNANGVCSDATAEQPTESAVWTNDGYIPTGSYEIIIYYEQQCNVGGPQAFTLTSDVNGEDAQSITGVVNPGQNYLARLTLDVDQNWRLFNGGVNANLDLAPVTPQETNPGQTIFGTITNDKPKDAYTFTAATGQVITADMQATSGSLDTLMILLGPDGRLVADNDDRPDGGTTDSYIQITATSTGTYTLISSRYAQVIGGTEGRYTLFVDVSTPVADAGDTTDTTTPEPSSTAVLPNGSIEVTLQWFTGADLQLQVRDPNGATVFDDVPTIGSGGILDQNFVGNRGCVTSTLESPTYYIYWPTNRVAPTGTYEVEVWFQNDCGDTSPVNFGLSVVVNDQLLTTGSNTTTATATATAIGNRYMTTFTLDNNGTVTLGEGGFFDMNSVATGLDYQAALPTAQRIEFDSIVDGQITLDQKFVVYQFDGLAGQRIGVELSRIGTGSLDTAVYVLDPTGVQAVGNDDIIPGENTNSRIQEYQLAFDGTYYIVATHYGLRYGATQGNFRLQLSLFP
ncbi:MAG: PPC domain-containing protein [Anaerolineales bacterium]|nr:PPC domain-containing protein [Anaerolineales bacterium]